MHKKLTITIDESENLEMAMDEKRESEANEWAEDVIRDDFAKNSSVKSMFGKKYAL